MVLSASLLILLNSVYLWATRTYISLIFSKKLPQEKGTLIHCWWECKLVQPLWKTVWRLLKKLKLEWPYDSAIPLLGR
jgi:hypothetical protein